MRLLALLPFGLACSNNGVIPPDDNDDLSVTSDSAGPTVPANPYTVVADPDAPAIDIDAAYFSVRSQFVWSEEDALFLPYHDEELGEQSTEVTVWILDSAALDTLEYDESSGCAMRFQIHDAIELPRWPARNSLWAGFDVDPNADVTLIDGCHAASLPESFGDNVADHVARWTWGIGVGELSESTAATLESTLTEEEWDIARPVTVGGTLRSTIIEASDLGDGAIFSEGIAVGYEVEFDDELGLHRLANDESGAVVSISTIFVNAVTGVHTGLYEVRMGLFDTGKALAGGQ